MLVAKALELHGRLDVFFANAGVSGGFEGIFDQTVEEWERILKINLIGPFLAIKHAGKAMADAGNGGSIICTACSRCVSCWSRRIAESAVGVA